MRERIVSLFSQRLKVVFIITTLQLVFTTGLIVWWGQLLVSQAYENATLAIATGDNRNEATDRVEKTKRMIVYEGAWFTFAITLSTLFLLGLYYRDVKRTRSLQAFFASLTHELKTPLTSVRLQAESIADLSFSDKYADALIKRLLQDTSRLETQVERALELARIEGGGALLARPVAIKPLIERMVDTCRQTEGDKIRIEDLTQDDLIYADAAALQIMMKNLFENSLRHSKRQPVNVCISSEVEGAKYKLCYADNGVGASLPQKHLGRLFSKSPDSQGAGVGLYLVSELIKKMGGDVSFANKDGFTARFSFKRGADYV